MVSNGDEYHIDRLHSTNNLYEEYKDAMIALNNDYYSYESFRLIRKHCFGHVKVRAFKAVSSKCATCARLAELRAKVSDND